jgi:hypothetical protein
MRGAERGMVEVMETLALTLIEYPAMQCERASGIARFYFGWCQPLS